MTALSVDSSSPVHSWVHSHFRRAAWRFAAGLLAIGVLAAAMGAGTAWGQESGSSFATLRGFVTDASTGRPLSGANVRLLTDGQRVRGGVSGGDGLYRFGRLEPGRYVLRVTFVGYQPYADTLQLDAGEVRTEPVELVPEQKQLDEVVVAGQENEPLLEAGRQRIQPADIQRIPTPQIGGDLAGYLKSLPSVVSTGDRGGRLFIRGSEPSQNILLVDGLPVFRPFHIVGFYSALPADLVANADVYAGGFGPRYNSRMSSVIDVSMTEGNKEEFESSFTASPFLLGLQVEGPVHDDISILGSYRRSILDGSEGLYATSLPYQFSDAFVKLHSAPTPNSRYSVFGLYTDDEGTISAGDVADANEFQWSNVVAGSRILVLPSDEPIRFEFTGGLSYASNSVGNPAFPDRSSQMLRFNTDLHFTRFYDDSFASIFDSGVLNWGLMFRMHWMDRTLAELFPSTASGSDVLFGGGGYLEAEVNLTEGWTVEPGAVVQIYAGEPVAPQPRLRTRWKIGDRHSLNAATGLYWQPLSGVSSLRDAGSGFTAWQPGSGGGGQMRAIHGLLGWEGRFGSLQATAEGYYRRLLNLPVPEIGVTSQSTSALSRANGNVYGIDTRLEYAQGPLYTQVSYGYSWTLYTADEPSLGSPNRPPISSYHPPHDRRHQVNALTTLTVGRYTASLRWEFGTGLPYTQFRGFDELILPDGVPRVNADFGTPRLFLDDPYGGRLPAYHRLDASVKATFSLRDVQGTVQVGGINLYNRSNVFYVDLFTAREVDQLPILPYLSLKLEL